MEAVGRGPLSSPARGDGVPLRGMATVSWWDGCSRPAHLFGLANLQRGRQGGGTGGGTASFGAAAAGSEDPLHPAPLPVIFCTGVFLFPIVLSPKSSPLSRFEAALGGIKDSHLVRQRQVRSVC